MDATVVIPTFNESANISALTEELARALRGENCNVLFVDDSDDNTPEIIRECARRLAGELSIRLIHRKGKARSGGLSGAVIDGIRHADGDYVVVMDGDLQHPPALIPRLLSTAHSRNVQLVVASRHHGDGDSAGLDSWTRRCVSRLSGAIARSLFPMRVGRLCSDPMTGFFCVRRRDLRLERLRPGGFKILLEILGSHSLSVEELPLHFGNRLGGASKASAANGLQFLRQLLTLRFNRLGRFLLASLAIWATTIGLVLADRRLNHLQALCIGLGLGLEIALTVSFAVANTRSRGRHSAQSSTRMPGRPPTKSEKYAYLDSRQHRWLFWVQAAAFIGVGASLYGMAHNDVWTLAFLGPLALFTIEQILALRTSTFRRRVTLPDHLFTVETYAPDRYPDIDVFLPTAGEPLSMLDTTYRHVANLNWPGRLSVYVLDDSARPEVGTLANLHGFRYLARTTHEFKKAGNLQYGFERSSGDHIAIFDADFVPRADFLTELVPYMDDANVGIVQSPQYFPTARGLPWLQRCAGATQEQFYRFVQPSRDAIGAAICVGTSAVYRRSALDAIGGIPQIGHSEDVYTGVLMNRVGFEVQYVPVLLSQGQSPDNLNSFIAQQYRWAEGSLSLALEADFHADTSLTGMQRLCFWSGFCYYLTTAMNAVLAPLAVLIMVWFFPQRVVAIDALPLVAAMLCWLVVLPAVSFGQWRADVLRVQAIYGFAHLFCIWDLFRGRTVGWIATNAATRHPLGGRVRAVMVTYISVAQGAVYWGLLRGTFRYGLERYWASLVLAAFTSFVYLPVAWLALRNPKASSGEVAVIDLTQRAQEASHRFAPNEWPAAIEVSL